MKTRDRCRRPRHAPFRRDDHPPQPDGGDRGPADRVAREIDLESAPLHATDEMGEVVSWYAGRKVFVTSHTGFKGGWLVAWLDRASAIVTGCGLVPDNGAYRGASST